jgi:hypothetical protein
MSRKFVTVLIRLHDKGRAMAQAVRRLPLTAQVRVLARVSPFGICGGQIGTGTGFFSPVLRFFPVSTILPGLSIHSI